jgi:hypothetical protein
MGDQTNYSLLSPEYDTENNEVVGCEEMTAWEQRVAPEPARSLGRRDLLRGAGLLGVAAAGAAMTPTIVEAAQNREPTPPTPAMRSPNTTGRSLTSDDKPAQPPLAVLVLNRMGFGPRPGDIAAFNALGSSNDARLQAYVDQQLDPQGIDDSACDAIIEGYEFETLGKSLQQLWADHLKQQGVDWRYRRLPVWETERVAFLRALHSKRQLTEVLADFWHNHFNAFGWDGWQQSTWVHYDRDVIRANMLGNFRKMVGNVAKSPTMLFYLDNQFNEGGNPNENWARELFELHTFGSENYFGVRKTDDPVIFDDGGKRRGYIDSDVYGATTCFTGWRTNTDTGEFRFDAAKHFPYQKIVLGEIIPEFMGEQDGEIVLDMLTNHRGTATFVARKLCRRLISDNPPESIVQAAAEVFYNKRDDDDQLKAVVRTILLSAEFRTTWGEKIKRPFEFACSIMRATQCNYDARSESFFWWYNAMGQSLFGWRPPDGYPDVKEVWSSTMPILQRWRFVNSLLDWKIGGEGADKDQRRVPIEGVMPADRTTPGQIVDYWSNRLLGITLPEGERQQIMEFMAYGRGVDSALPSNQINERLRHMVALILMSPSFQWR